MDAALRRPVGAALRLCPHYTNTSTGAAGADFNHLLRLLPVAARRQTAVIELKMAALCRVAATSVRFLDIVP